MTSADHADDGALALAERIFVMLNRGGFVATYKYAVLLALLDLCLELTSQQGEPPTSLTTRQLAEKVVQLYWPHTMPFRTAQRVLVLRQNNAGQAELVGLIERFRKSHASYSTPAQAQRGAKGEFEQLVRDIEWKLIEMPLPRLQVVGRKKEEFLYGIGWDKEVRLADVRAYQATGLGFNNNITLLPSVGAQLVRLNGLLRPFIHREWATKGADLNSLEEARLERFLFGADRQRTAQLREPLRKLQKDRCFYCGERLGPRTEVDHFIPWARYPDDAVENLVAADGRCNAAKRDFLASGGHLGRWMERLVVHAGALAEIAAAASWESRAPATGGVATAIYLGLPDGVDLWVAGDRFEPSRHEELMRALRAA